MLDATAVGMTRAARAVATLALVALACALASVAAQPPSSADATLPAADSKAIQRVIREQLAALKAGEGDKAFGYASPGIRAQFGDAPTFMAMVRSGYAALLTARYSEFLEGAVIDGRVIQPLRLIAPDNSVVVALYTMEKHDGRWRIAGCVLAPSTVRAA
jgi:hypothetical protein